MALSLVQPKDSSTEVPVPVLILEDERFDRHRLARMCSGLSIRCEVSNATTLARFAEALEGEIFGLILLDFTLPDGDGFDALEMVRLSARNLNAPTLMISGRDDDGIADKARDAGCTAYLNKDTLTAAGFRRAVEDALAPALDPLPAMRDSFDSDDMARLIGHVNRRNARDVKPMVSRMMRQLRGMRTHATAEEGVALQAVEQNCMSLWAFLVEMEQQEGGALLRDLKRDTPDSFPAAARKPRKPPSPFSRLRH